MLSMFVMAKSKEYWTSCTVRFLSLQKMAFCVCRLSMAHGKRPNKKKNIYI